MALSGKTVGMVAGAFAGGALTVAGVWSLTNWVGTPSGSVNETVQAASGTPEGLTPIAQLQRNQVVTIAGTVTAIRDEDEFVLQDDTGSVTVWTGGMMFAVTPGEQVTVAGFVDNDLILEVYAQEITRASGDVVLITRPQATAAPTEAPTDPGPSGAGVVETESITPIGSLTRGSFVTISGTVDRVSDEDEFVLRDDTGTVTVWTGGVLFAVSPGQEVSVRGFVDEDLLLEVYAQEIITDTGQVITVGGYSSSE